VLCFMYVVRMPLCLYLRPDIIQLAEQALIGQVAGMVACQNHDIKVTQSCAPATERFANYPLDAVAIRRPWDTALCDRQPQPCRIVRAMACDYNQSGTYKPAPIAKYQAKRFRLPQTGRRWKLHAGHKCTAIAQANYGVRRLRPFARRAPITLRPPRVAMRARNPWVRLRRTLLG